MKAVIFGGSGFLGSHVADMLTRAQIDVTIFDLMPSTHLKPRQTMIIGDIRDAQKVAAAVGGQDYVLNFAGIAGLEDARKKPIQAADVNILGNLNILEAMVKHPPKRYIFASTYYVYSEFGSVYRITKQACELFIEDYAARFDLNYSILRFGSLYGERSNESNAVYRFLKDAMTKNKIVRDGSGEDIREYVHVIDAARSTVEVMMKQEYENQHVILAGNQRIKIKELLEMIREIMSKDIEIEYKPLPENDMDHYKITPYAFKPKTALRYTGEGYHDLGQGLLQMLYSIRDQMHEDEIHSVDRIQWKTPEV